MAVVNTKCGTITNRDASPRVLNNPGAAAGRVVGFSGTLETVSGDDIASTYRMGQVPSNAVMFSLRVYSDDIGTACEGDIGIYQTTENGAAVVDADVFASAFVFDAGALNGTDVLHESAVTAWGLEDAEKPLWQALGLSSDPGILYDVVITLTEAANAAGTITVRGSYCI